MSGFRLAVFALIVVPGMVAGAPVGTSRVPLYWLWNEQLNDSAYTVSAERRDRLVRDGGYVDMGAIALVEACPAPQTRPLKCFYSPSPRTDTFCSTSPLEHRLIGRLGYEEVGVEGFVRVERGPGTVALFRVSRAYRNGADHEHRFITSPDELVRLRKQGWTYDGARAYVYPLP